MTENEQIYDGLNRVYFSRDCHEKKIIENLDKLLDGVEVFLDVGASLGQYTYYVSRILTGARIIAIEADPVRAAKLQENCTQWQAASGNTLTTVAAAACEMLGQGSFFVTNSCTSGGMFCHSVPRPSGREQPDWQEIRVRQVTLDSLFDGERPAVCKIDVEGAELRVLKGAQDILRKGNTTFLVELHSWPDPQGQQNAKEVVSFMESFGYCRRSFYGMPLFCRGTGLLGAFGKNRNAGTRLAGGLRRLAANLLRRR